jgi:aspartyl protease family protein
MRSVITFAAMALIAGTIVPRYVQQMSDRRGPSDDRAPAAAATPASGEPETVEVPRDASGHFRVQARIDGLSLEFMLDTGASMIALTAEDASQLGIHPAHDEYRVLLKTANGAVGAARARLGMVEIGGIMVRDVDAVVLPPGALSENLLGMSFLSRLHHFEYSAGKLVLEQ